MPARALVVLCPKRPDLAGQPLLGHVAWGFELPHGDWMIGAVEGDGWHQGNGFNGFWSERVPDLGQALRHFSQMAYHQAEYNQYKLLTMTPNVYPDPDGAMQVMKWVSGQKYELFGRNCMNSAYDILRAFSRGGNYNHQVLPSPDLNWIPNGWFNAIKVPDQDYRYLPVPVHAFQSATEAVASEDTLSGVEPLFPSWRDPASAEYVPVDAEAAEKAEKSEVSVPEPADA